MKWDMGWMHDTLEYMSAGPDLPEVPPRQADVPHDVRLLGELRPPPLARRGRARQRLAARRRCPATTGRSSPTSALLFGYMYAQPGKKLLFMGGEFGQWREWNHDTEPGLASRGSTAQPRAAALGRGSEHGSTGTSRRCTSSITTAPGSNGSTARRGAERRQPDPLEEPPPRARSSWPFSTSRRCRATTTRSAFPRGGWWEEA